MYQIYGLCLDPHKIECSDRWVFAGSPFLLEGAPEKSRKRILFFLCGFGCVRALVSLLISIIHLGFFAIKHERNRAYSEEMASVVLMGFGAGAEKSIFSKIKEQHRSDNVIEFSSLTKDYYYSFEPRPSFFSVFKVMVGLWWRSYRTLTIHKSRQQRLDIRWFIYLSSATFEYAVWYCWARAAKKRVRKAYVICNDLRSFALVNSGVSVEYVQHGFLNKNLVFPDYNWISVMTSIDERFVSERVRGALIRVIPKYDLENFDGKVLAPDLEDFFSGDVKSVFIASVYGSDVFYQRVKNLFDYLHGRGSFNVTVKVHPSESSSFWVALSEKYCFKVLPSDKDLVECLKHINPDVFVSWFSTSFLDAFDLGIKSLSLCTQEELDGAGLVFNLSVYANTYDDLAFLSKNHFSLGAGQR